MLTFIRKFFHPTIDFFLIPPSTIPWSIRWRLLAFQPLVLLTSLVTHLPYFLRRKPHTQLWIPTRSGASLRVLLFRPPSTSAASTSVLRPLHLDLHGGAFVGGHPEADRRFCAYVAEHTGAVVVSASYRFAPRYPFPAAIDDVDDVLAWLRANARKLGVDADLVTVGGSSAGGNLALAACVTANAADEKPVKGSVTFYAPIDLRIPPWKKPAPPNLPTKDPMVHFLPLFDAYPGPVRTDNMDNPRLSPMVMDLQLIPEDVLLVVPGIDILVHEQQEFAKRLNAEIEAMGDAGRHRRVELMEIPEAFHGWMELPSSIMEEQRMRVFERSVEFLKEIHRKHGFVLDEAQ